ncbi:uncharacterized protein EI97DRAFT_430213 [Westerdykella ornata]|uniref:Uncharacterized protein n=1 Tax=Westerdykella ornata TaxID=318751 RepID=A0A6A6JWA1_WESOR|nr:uncharacterized protein EI97DRAFT_430213 [Westerdykella ornata]KAF2280505.1 hypothetical protein EI97DRAFT_430213 [Westerdykella ornata]
MAIPHPTPPVSLTPNDARILTALFDPETLPSNISTSKSPSTIDPSLPAHPSIPSERLNALEARQNELVKRTANASGEEAEKILEEVEYELHAIIKEEAEYPSAYLNRAMLRRMRLENAMNCSTPTSPSETASEKASPPTQSIFTYHPESHIEPIFADLSKAITLSTPSPSTSPASTYQARILRTAHSHRAYLYLKASESGNGKLFKGRSKTDLEELASRDFSQAAKYGDEVAREMSVRTNPYAKMCGAIVRNALREERGEV